MNKVSKSYNILKEEGIVEFIRQLRSYVTNQLYSVFWEFRDRQTIHIGDVSGDFHVPTYEVYKNNQYRLTTEKAVLEDLLFELKPSDVFWDVGANTGLFSILAAKRCQQGCVIAFEPYPPNFELLAKNIELNDVKGSELYDLALSNEDGTIQFNQPDSKEFGYGSASIGVGGRDGKINVPTSTGDNLVTTEGVPLPNIVKIDVEGAEPLVIEGMADTLSSDGCRLLYCEVHLEATDLRPSIEEFGSSLDDLLDKIESYGFSVNRLQEREGELFLKCSK